MPQDERKHRTDGWDWAVTIAAVSVYAVTCGLIWHWLFFIVPQMAQMFIQLDVPLPSLTRLYLGICYYLRNYWFLFLPVAVVASAVPLAVARQRAWLAYILASLLALLLAFGGAVSMVMPMFVIQNHGLQKRR